VLDARVIAFLVLSIGIIIGFDYLQRELGYVQDPVPAEQGPSFPAAVPPPSESSRSGSLPTPAGTQSPAAPTRAQASDGSSAQTVSERQEVVTTDLYRAVFSTKGAEIAGWELTRYLTSDPRKPAPVQMRYQEGQFAGPLALRTDRAEQTAQLRQGIYQVERDFTSLDAAHPTGHLVFTYRSPDGQMRVSKSLTFHHHSYVVDVSVSADGLTGPLDIGLGTNFGIVEWGEGFIGLIGPASLVDEKVEKEMPDTESQRAGAVKWVAIQDKYFLSVLMPSGAAAAVVKKEGEKLVSSAVRYASASSPMSMRLYAGPKEFDTLKAFDVGLEDTIDFGWFIFGSWDIVKAVAKPLFAVLRSVNDVTRNYGVTIILLTVGIKLLFVPLQYKSYKSMKQMQVIQPKVAALQDKYKDDRERLNRELIKLYRDHKVNPVGGCLPMLLQMPVFVALFNILYMTIDLRQAPFVLWVRDLSVQDPYYVLPILMGISMVVQQKIMPTTMDPTQAKVMLILPAMMTLLFLNFPAGLVLYWLTNNVLTIAQQFVTDHYLFRPAAVETATESAAPSKKKPDQAGVSVSADRSAES
jgi:YidC/Oxa1 family membrane protein insertase